MTHTGAHIGCRTLIILVIVAVASLGAAAQAAVIELRDGHVFVGSIVKADRDTLTIETNEGQRILRHSDLARITFGKTPRQGGPQAGGTRMEIEDELADLIRTMVKKAKEAVEGLDLTPKPDRR